MAIYFAKTVILVIFQGAIRNSVLKSETIFKSMTNPGYYHVHGTMLYTLDRILHCRVTEMRQKERERDHPLNCRCKVRAYSKATFIACSLPAH